MTWKTGKRSLRTYQTKEHSFAHFEDIWMRKYNGECPTIEHAKKWTGKDRAETWLQHVYSVYDCRNTISIT